MWYIGQEEYLKTTSGYGKKKQLNPIFLDHTRAAELCLHVDRISTDPTDTLEIKFIPIRVDVDERILDHLVHKCVFWKFIPCGQSKDYSLWNFSLFSFVVS